MGDAGALEWLLLKNTKNQSKVLPRHLPTLIRKCFQQQQDRRKSDCSHSCRAPGIGWNKHLQNLEVPVECRTTFCPVLGDLQRRIQAPFDRVMRHKGRISHPDAGKLISGRSRLRESSQGESLLWVNSLPGSGARPPEAAGHGGWRHQLALQHPQPAPAIQGSSKAPTWAGVRSKSKATGRSGAQLQTTPRSEGQVPYPQAGKASFPARQEGTETWPDISEVPGTLQKR